MHIRVEICSIIKRRMAQRVRMHDEIGKKKPLDSAMGQSIHFVLKVIQGSKTITSFHKLISINPVGVINSVYIKPV